MVVRGPVLLGEEQIPSSEGGGRNSTEPVDGTVFASRFCLITVYVLDAR
jgi:hypothetical protein